MEIQIEQPTSIDQPGGDERLWAVYCHLALILILFSRGLFLLPLVLWLAKRHSYAFVEEQGKEAINFQITLMAILVAFAIAFSFARMISGLIGFNLDPGILHWPPVLFGIFYILLATVAAWSAANGKHYRYPLPFRFIK